MLQLKLTTFFCIEKLSYIRLKQAPKLCLKKKFLFLLKQVTPRQRLNNIVLFRGNFKHVYHPLNYSYKLFLDLVEEKKISIYSLFFYTLNTDLMVLSLDYTLFIWGGLINTMFRLEKLKVHKTFKLWVRYIKPLKRYLLVWRWLGVLIKFLYLNYKSFVISFISLWHEFFLQPIENNKLVKLKIFVYKIYLYKLY